MNNIIRTCEAHNLDPKLVVVNAASLFKAMRHFARGRFEFLKQYEDFFEIAKLGLAGDKVADVTMMLINLSIGVIESAEELVALKKNNE